MKKYIVLLFALIICFSLCACDSSANELEGNWVCQEVHSGYPDQMILNEDGTGTTDGISCTWYAKDGVITLTIAGLLTEDYTYEFRDSVLYLDGYGYDKQ